MRKIITSNLVSLDGYLAGPGGDLSWRTVNDEFLKYNPETNGTNRCKTVKYRRSNALLSTPKINFKY